MYSFRGIYNALVITFSIPSLIVQVCVKEQPDTEINVTLLYFFIFP